LYLILSFLTFVHASVRLLALSAFGTTKK